MGAKDGDSIGFGVNASTAWQTQKNCGEYLNLPSPLEVVQLSRLTLFTILREGVCVLPVLSRNATAFDSGEKPTLAACSLSNLWMVST